MTTATTTLNPAAVDWSEFSDVWLFSSTDEKSYIEEFFISKKNPPVTCRDLRYDAGTSCFSFYGHGPEADIRRHLHVGYIASIIALRYKDDPELLSRRVLQEILVWVNNPAYTDPRVTAIPVLNELVRVLGLNGLRKQLASFMSRKLPCES